MMPASQPAMDRGRPYAHAFDLYWSAGWRGVIPVRGKYPPPDNYTGASGLWPSYADCYAWSETHGAQNIALRLPQYIIGLDVDNYDGKRGGATLFDCQILWGELPQTWRSTSRDDGISGIRHFRVPTDLSWPGQLPGGGVELIRWDHRYTVCWPSVHPNTNGVYRWIDPRGAVLINGVPNPDDLPELPPAWVEGLTRGAWQHDDKADLNSVAASAFLFGLNGAEDELCPRMSYLASHVVASMADSRHDVVRGAVLDLVRKAEEGHPGIVKALQSVSDAFVLAVTADGSRSTNTAAGEFVRMVNGALQIVANGRRTPSIGDPCIVPSDPPYRPGELLDRFGRRMTHAEPRSAVSDDLRAAQTPTSSTDEIDPLVAERLRWRRADRQAVRLLDAEERAEIEQPPERMTAQVFFADDIQRPQYVIDKVLPSGSRVVLAAQHKAGKTTLVGNLVRSICDSVPFLGFEASIPDGQNAALLDFEMDPYTLRRWLMAMQIRNPDRAFIFPLLGKVRQFDIRDERVFAAWVDRLQGVGTVIIDCLKPILDQLGLDEHHDTGQFTTPLTALKDAAGIKQLILVHHMGHNGERSRGDSALRGWPEAEWFVVRSSKDADHEAELDAPRFFKAYGRDVNVPECELGYDPQTRILTIAGMQSREQTRNQEKDDRLRAAILAAVASHPGIIRNQIPAWLSEQGMGTRKATVLAAIRSIVEARLVRVQLSGPSNMTHRLYPLDYSE